MGNRRVHGAIHCIPPTAHLPRHRRGVSKTPVPCAKPLPLRAVSLVSVAVAPAEEVVSCTALCVAFSLLLLQPVPSTPIAVATKDVMVYEVRFRAHNAWQKYFEMLRHGHRATTNRNMHSLRPLISLRVP